MAQYFKGDAREQRYHNSAAPLLSDLSDQKSTFFEEAFDCYVLGELLWDTGRAPMANGIARPIFRESFSALFEAFLNAGTAESYLLVFRKIFGEDVEVTFTVPAPGKLLIDLQAIGLETSNWVSRYIEDNQYFFDQMKDQNNDLLIFRSVKGIESEYELNQLLFEMVPDGIYTEITLTVGGD